MLRRHSGVPAVHIQVAAGHGVGGGTLNYNTHLERDVKLDRTQHRCESTGGARGSRCTFAGSLSTRGG